MQLQVDISGQTCLIIQKSVKKVVFFFLFFDGFQRPRSFGPMTSRITKKKYCFDLVELKIDQGFQKCITSWLSDQ